MTNVKDTIALEAEIRTLESVIVKQHHALQEYRKKLSFYTEPFKLRPTYQILEQRLEKIEAMVDSHDGSDYNARQIFDDIESELKEKS